MPSFYWIFSLICMLFLIFPGSKDFRDKLHTRLLTVIVYVAVSLIIHSVYQ